MRREYKRYYKDFVECDLCGSHTRGRVYNHARSKVVCGSCGGMLLEKPVTLPEVPWKDESEA